ncbi:MAG TPA: GrpB family protein [Clostridiales bacterium]|nr:GrpB family protein [Clostridiales bacterium]
MNTKHVTVEDYNPEWKNEFKRISNELSAVLADKIISIGHVGSTSVEGLAAKPVIDIVIDNNFEEAKQTLELTGYLYEGDFYFDPFKLEFLWVDVKIFNKAEKYSLEGLL